MQALIHAHLGHDAPTRELAERALDLSGDEVRSRLDVRPLALGHLELALGNARNAHAWLDPACSHAEREDIGEPATTRFVFDDEEALTVLGRREEAMRRLSRAERHAVRLDRAVALAASARCRGLLATATGDLQTAFEDFDRALGELTRRPHPFERARTLLAQGAALRRAQRRREARTALWDARSEFERLGARLWARRAENELSRISGRAPSRDELTPTERRVVELVVQGGTNREVAAALFVTPKTVEFHLRNVFRKLGVRSRTELVRLKT
ncbi:MAG TPA: LuxR C-terminal-related transcriptional regulator [Gaiellaceae bacterium]|nr:LuxR C-terminal-related transcriptional regulator [Gaiellaceae bacterium]